MRIPGLRIAKAVTWFVYALLLVAVVILGIAFFLELFNASAAAPFTQWIYRSASVVLAPFRGIFPPIEGENGSVLNFAILFAIMMYGLLAAAVESLLVWLDSKIRRARANEYAGQGQLPDPGLTEV
jgi:uncharacterized protein YggT (Ycf19 family)